MLILKIRNITKNAILGPSFRAIRVLESIKAFLRESRPDCFLINLGICMNRDPHAFPSDINSLVCGCHLPFVRNPYRYCYAYHRSIVKQHFTYIAYLRPRFLLSFHHGPVHESTFRSFQSRRSSGQCKHNTSIASTNRLRLTYCADTFLHPATSSRWQHCRSVVVLPSFLYRLFSKLIIFF